MVVRQLDWCDTREDPSVDPATETAATAQHTAITREVTRETQFTGSDVTPIDLADVGYRLLDGAEAVLWNNRVACYWWMHFSVFGHYTSLRNSYWYSSD